MSLEAKAVFDPVRMKLETEAKAILETGDWVKDKMLLIHEDGTCGLCLVGALRVAFNNTWQWQAGLRAKTEYVPRDAPNYAAYSAVIERVTERIQDRDPAYRELADEEDTLMRFNDAEDTSFDDVLAVLTPS